MPNGDGLSEQEFVKLDEAFSSLDCALAAFSQDIGGEYIRNYHGPERRIAYLGPDGIQRHMLFSPVIYERDLGQKSGPPRFVKLQAPEFSMAIAAWKDKDGKRRSWHRIIERKATLPRPEEIDSLLMQMYSQLNSVEDVDLTER